MIAPPQDVIDTATRAASLSTCRKSHRGVVIFNTSKRSSRFIGWNHPPTHFACDGSDECRAHCNKLCVHAEVEALKSFLQADPNRGGWWELLHVKVVEGVVVPSGPPSCWQCSREILDIDDLTHVWLLHEDGWRRYTSVEFHELTLVHNGLPVIRSKETP